jgi:hypothetical protein
LCKIANVLIEPGFVTGSRLAFGDVWVRSHQLQDNLPDMQASLHALVGLGGLI